MTRANNNAEINCSGNHLHEFPDIRDADEVVELDVSKNFIQTIPSLNRFTNLKVLNLSRNKISDLKPLLSAPTIVKLDCSHNSISNIDCLESFRELRVLNASNNSIETIEVRLPNSLTDINLSHNNISTFEFLQTCFGDKVADLDITGNNVTEVRSLRFFAVLQKLKSLNTGLLQINRDVNIMPFIKHICPSLETFDHHSCTVAPGSEITKAEELLEILLRGTESELKTFLRNADSIRWDDPVFVQYDTATNSTPLKGIEERLRLIEERIPSDSDNMKDMKHASSPNDKGEIRQLKSEISEIKQQVKKMAELLYVHDGAMKLIWDSKH